MSKWDPVAYSASTRKTIAKLEEQIELTEKYISDFTPRPDRLGAEYGKLVGLSISLSSLAEQHRQWPDFERYQAVQGRYARRLSDLQWRNDVRPATAPQS